MSPKFVFGIGFVGLMLLVIGARDAWIAWGDEASIRDGVESMVAGALCLAVLLAGVWLRGRRA